MNAHIHPSIDIWRTQVSQQISILFLVSIETKGKFALSLWKQNAPVCQLTWSRRRFAAELLYSLSSPFLPIKHNIYIPNLTDHTNHQGNKWTNHKNNLLQHLCVWRLNIMNWSLSKSWNSSHKEDLAPASAEVTDCDACVDIKDESQCEVKTKIMFLPKIYPGIIQTGCFSF